MIQLLWCTIRPYNFPSAHTEWMKRVKSVDSIFSSVLVSTDQEKEFIETYFLRNSLKGRVVSYKPPYPGVCLPSYKLSSTLEADMDDVVVFASDDFLPPTSWDSYVTEKLSNITGALLVNDGYQKIDFSNMEHPVFSIPIMKYECLTRLNLVIYHPAYSHLYSDAELYLNLNEMSLIVDDRKNSPDMVFEHHHWSSGKRNPDSNDQSYYNNREKDRLTWEKRRNLSLDQRLLVDESFI